jgi:hypothetical protein
MFSIFLGLNPALPPASPFHPSYGPIAWLLKLRDAKGR